MKIPKSFKEVTTFSKLVALGLFVALPFIGFYLGSWYQEKLCPDNNTDVQDETTSTDEVNTSETESSTYPESFSEYLEGIPECEDGYISEILTPEIPGEYPSYSFIDNSGSVFSTPIFYDRTCTKNLKDYVISLNLPEFSNEDFLDVDLAFHNEVLVSTLDQGDTSSTFYVYKYNLYDGSLEELFSIPNITPRVDRFIYPWNIAYTGVDSIMLYGPTLVHGCMGVEDCNETEQFIDEHCTEINDFIGTWVFNTQTETLEHFQTEVDYCEDV